MIQNLRKEDAETLLLHHFWLSKAFSFIAFPAKTFVSKRIGNYHFYTNETSEKNQKPNHLHDN